LGNKCTPDGPLHVSERGKLGLFVGTRGTMPFSPYQQHGCERKTIARPHGAQQQAEKASFPGAETTEVERPNTRDSEPKRRALGAGLAEYDIAE